ncbi:hypothetical protein FNJ84_08140 [Paracoccus sp. M683]|uniref:hypothetical protein n=1 Tax=Paracoccus sp. M683 TaxID=2594268 RepID=UPI00117CA767|nr:hypothetical protein [Paracoccus sp. M683]TRW97469.1 hypothetical protein FNJ84_08140 [Paracoccus sp. M683]
MPSRALTIALVTACLAAPAFAQDAGSELPKPVIIQPTPAETDANLQTSPETVKPVNSSGCSRSKAVTS